MNYSTLFGGNIKRVQRGVATHLELTKTLEFPVDMEHSIIIEGYTMSGSVAVSQYVVPSVCSSITAPTEVTIHWGVRSIDAVLAYQVIEFYK
jgi:hypothetical protein